MVINMKMAQLLLLGLVASAGVSAKVMDVGLMDQDRPPYFKKPTISRPASGMYIDILNEIGHITGIRFKYKFLPQKRIRAYMKLGLLDVEPGIAKIWREEPEEEETSVYTDVLFSSEEALVYNPSKFPSSKPTAKELMNSYTPCSVLGFDRMDEGTDSSHDLITETQILELIKRQRCDWAAFPVDVIKNRLKSKKLACTKPVAAYDLRIRFSVKNSGYIENVNYAIREIKASGKLQEIIERHVGRK